MALKGSKEIIDKTDEDRVKKALPLGRLLGDDHANQFLRPASLARIPAGRDVMAEGDRLEAIPLVLSGSIRVFKIGESGREITLYRFTRGECCVLTADSILGEHLFPASAQIEEEAEVAFVPKAALDAWLASSAPWRRFVFEAMSRRLLSLMETLDQVAFGRMDSRVALLLLQRSSGEAATLKITHQEIADELGSSREVISRILEDLQARALISLSRGAVQVVDPGLLATTATEA